MGLLVTTVLTGLLLAGQEQSPGLSARLAALTPDAAPAATTNGIHYLTSNERRLDLYLPEIAGQGGAYLGVGSDQNYILAGWARPDLMVIVDFDQAVVDLHSVYEAFFIAAKTPSEHRRLWTKKGAADAHATIKARFPGARGRQLVRLYTESRKEVLARIDVLTTKYDDLGIHWVFEDAEQYRVVRRLWERERVIVVRGDFTKDGVLREIGETLTDAGRSLRTLYLSNIEQYFMYGKDYRANMLGLPFTEDTLVLRTLPGRPAGFQYILQEGPGFHAWLAAKNVYSVYRVRGKAKGEFLHASEKYVIDELPDG